MNKLFIILIIVLGSVGCSSHRPYDGEPEYYQENESEPYITIYEWEF